MSARDTALVALFAALIVVLGFTPAVPIPFLPVPITLQGFGVMLAGLVLGPRLGPLAPLVVIGLVALGLPVLSGGRGGLAVFAGPTVGYLVAWPAGAYVTGAIAAAGARARWPFLHAFVACLAGGILCIYAGGIAWLALAVGTPLRALLIGNLAFVPGDLLKAALAALVAVRLRAAYPNLPVFTEPRSRR